MDSSQESLPMITDHMKLDEQDDSKFKEECQALYNVIRKKKD